MVLYKLSFEYLRSYEGKCWQAKYYHASSDCETYQNVITVLQAYKGCLKIIESMRLSITGLHARYVRWKLYLGLFNF